MDSKSQGKSVLDYGNSVIILEAQAKGCSVNHGHVSIEFASKTNNRVFAGRFLGANVNLYLTDRMQLLIEIEKQGVGVG